MGTKSPKKDDWKHLAFDERLSELRRVSESDPDALEILNAISRNPTRAFAIFDLLDKPRSERPKTGGRPKKWGIAETEMGWAAVEIQVRIARESQPGVGVLAAMTAFFRKRNHPKLAFSKRNPHPEIGTAGRAKRIHDEGAKLLKSRPDDAKLFNRIVAADLMVRQRGNST
jgi:hypothetical protein